MKVGGIVLCGGQSSRMGRSKAWLPFAGEPLLSRIVRLTGEVVAPIVVVAAADQELPPLPETVILVRDALPGRGPLQGLAAGLAALENEEAAYVSSCDVPTLSPAFVRRVIELLGAYRIAVPEVGGHLHPLAAVYRTDVLPIVERMLAADRLRTRDLFDEVPTRFLSEEELASVDPGLRSLRNVNTSEEYQAVLREPPID